MAKLSAKGRTTIYHLTKTIKSDDGLSYNIHHLRLMSDGNVLTKFCCKDARTGRSSLAGAWKVVKYTKDYVDSKPNPGIWLAMRLKTGWIQVD